MTMKTNTPTGSVERVIRTFGQVAVGAVAAFPTLVDIFHVSPTLSAEVIGAVGAIVTAVTAVQNALESKGIIPAALRYVPPAAPVDPATPAK